MEKYRQSEIKSFLDYKADLYENENFIEDDPVSIPHLFSKKEDIEISAFITSTISWGLRKTILNNAKKIVEMMDLSPFDFIQNHSKSDLGPLSKFVHRTFNGNDLIFFITSLKNIYINHGGLENLFKPNNLNSLVRGFIFHIKGSPPVTTIVSEYLWAVSTISLTAVGGCKLGFQLSFTSHQ